MSDELVDCVRVRFGDRDAWKAYRKRGFGASESSALLGVNPWKSAAAVILAKASEAQDEREDSEDQRVRRLLEPGIARNYQHVEPDLAVTLNEDIFYRTATPYVFATPDGFAGPRILELKTSSSTPERWDEEGVPVAYQIQVQQQMLCCARPYADLACLFTGNGQYAFRIYRYTADADFQDLLVAQLAEAWAIVEAIRRGESPPIPDAGAADNALLARFRPPVPSKVVQMAAPDLELAQRWIARNTERASYQKIADGLEELAKADQNALLSRMNGAELATFEGSSLRLVSKLVKRAAYKVDATEYLTLKPAKEDARG